MEFLTDRARPTPPLYPDLQSVIRKRSFDRLKILFGFIKSEEWKELADIVEESNTQIALSMVDPATNPDQSDLDRGRGYVSFARTLIAIFPEIVAETYMERKTEDDTSLATE